MVSDHHQRVNGRAAPLGRALPANVTAAWPNVPGRAGLRGGRGRESFTARLRWPRATALPTPAGGGQL